MYVTKVLCSECSLFFPRYLGLCQEKEHFIVYSIP